MPRVNDPEDENVKTLREKQKMQENNAAFSPFSTEFYHYPNFKYLQTTQQMLSKTLNLSCTKMLSRGVFLLDVKSHFCVVKL